MNDEILDAEPAPAGPHPYRVFCIVALAALTVALIERQMGNWAFVPAVAGGLSLIRCWRGGPVVVLLTLAVGVAATARGVDPVYLLYWLIYGATPGGSGGSAAQRLDPLTDIAACAAVLAFVAAHYRLQMSERFSFPAESLKRASLFLGSPPSDGEERRKRRREQTTPLEIGLLAATLPLMAGLAALLFFWLTRNAPQLTVAEGAWRMPVLLFWSLVVALGLLGTLLGYQRQSNLEPAEAALYLQDQLWRETRGDQQRLNRWLAGAKLRKQRRRKSS